MHWTTVGWPWMWRATARRLAPPHEKIWYYRSSKFCKSLPDTYQLIDQLHSTFSLSHVYLDMRWRGMLSVTAWSSAKLCRSSISLVTEVTNFLSYFLFWLNIDICYLEKSHGKFCLIFIVVDLLIWAFCIASLQYDRRWIMLCNLNSTCLIKCLYFADCFLVGILKRCWLLNWGLIGLSNGE